MVFVFWHHLNRPGQYPSISYTRAGSTESHLNQTFWSASGIYFNVALDAYITVSIQWLACPRFQVILEPNLSSQDWSWVRRSSLALPCAEQPFRPCIVSSQHTLLSAGAENSLSLPDVLVLQSLLAILEIRHGGGCCSRTFLASRGC